MIRTVLNSVSCTETGTEPVTVAKAKTYLGIASSVHDALLADLVVSARKNFEQATELKLIESTVTAYYDSIDDYTYLPFVPCLELTSVQDEDNNDLDYILTKGENPKLKITSSSEVVVVYDCGVTVTEDIELAVIKAVSEDFEFRTGISLNTSELLPNNWRQTVLKYRRTWLM